MAKRHRKHIFLAQAALLFFLLLAVVIYVGRIVGGNGGMNLGSRHIAALSPQTRTFLSGLRTPLSLTYFVSARDKMPSHLKGVEGSVSDLLDAIVAAAPGQVDVRIIDPEMSGPQGIAYASRKKVSPFSVRKIRQDEHSEQKVWSSLVLAYADQPEVLIQGITDVDLPYLEDLIVRNLRAHATPLAPVFAVAAPAHFETLKALLSQHGRVIQVNLDASPRIPPDADVLFWLEPQRVTPVHLREFQRFVASGRTAILAGSAYTVGYEKTETGHIGYRAYPLSTAWDALLSPLGVQPQPDLLMDASSGPIFWGDSTGAVHQVEAPFHLRCMPGFYALKGFAGPARGALNFVSASPFDMDPRRLSSAGFHAEILATTTENAWVAPLPDGPFGNDRLAPEFRVGKQNLMLHLVPRNPWWGQILILGSASPFWDGVIAQPGYAHRVFLQTLLRTFTSAERLVHGRVARPQPEAIPPLGFAARFFWRAAAVFLVPVVLLALGTRRYLSGGGRWSALRSAGRLPVHIGVPLLLVLVGTQVWKGRAGTLLDLTQGSVNTPLPLTRSLLGSDLQADLILSPRASLPPAMKGMEAALQSRLRDIGVNTRTIRPNALSRTEQLRLGALGLQPFEVRTVRNDSTTAQRIWSGLLLRQGTNATAVPRLDVRTMDHLEFLIVAAAKRLKDRRAPHIGLIAEPPRLSPAEAFEYHQQGLSPPKGADVFSSAKSLLRNYGYRVTYINPREPHLPEGTDLLFWLQPRRDSSPTTAILSRYLSDGGKAIVALQHFNIQQRQYRGTGFQTVYWPQPQYQDLDPYLELFGVKQVREVLMDRTRFRLSMETQINRRAVREYEDQEVALPFLIRAVGPNFSAASPITANLGDLLFIWGNRFALDRDRLNALKLSAQALISTSDRAWSYDWRGGWLPPEIFQPESFLNGPQPLTVLLEGRFPLADARRASEENAERVLQPAAETQANGALLLIGCSEIFKNDHLYAGGFQHDQFLLNTAAYLTHGPDMARLQSRRRTAHGFAFQTPQHKAVWRLTVVGAAPLLILLYGLSRYVTRRRATGSEP